eukprot:NODE_28975_length_460_cov_1.825826.p1 GENE.NODE_28975_length_460_cov_1.825826~~NODE_28975_length_460_cov_1.825826.p1  ORF type:complete len:106 (-),score=22.54 NODE_28975_length_460_cov_1.825826:59-376(-)
MRVFSVILVALALATPAGAVLVRRTTRGCPLCEAAEQCSQACADIKHTNPGNPYCLTACIGAEPGQEFGTAFFAGADAKLKESRELDESMWKTAREFEAEMKARS